VSSFVIVSNRSSFLPEIDYMSSHLVEKNEASRWTDFGGGVVFLSTPSAVPNDDWPGTAPHRAAAIPSLSASQKEEKK
jgi:hypothetical protein